MSEQVTMLSTSWCGHCRRLGRQLAAAGIAFSVVDIEERPELALRIETETGGYRTVPTLEIEGRLLVNPSVADVQKALESN